MRILLLVCSIFVSSLWASSDNGEIKRIYFNFGHADLDAQKKEITFDFISFLPYKQHYTFIKKDQNTTGHFVLESEKKYEINENNRFYLDGKYYSSVQDFNLKLQTNLVIKNKYLINDFNSFFAAFKLASDEDKAFIVQQDYDWFLSTINLEEWIAYKHDDQATLLLLFLRHQKDHIVNNCVENLLNKNYFLHYKYDRDLFFNYFFDRLNSSNKNNFIIKLAEIYNKFSESAWKNNIANLVKGKINHKEQALAWLNSLSLNERVKESKQFIPYLTDLTIQEKEKLFVEIMDVKQISVIENLIAKKIKKDKKIKVFYDNFILKTDDDYNCIAIYSLKENLEVSKYCQGLGKSFLVMHEEQNHAINNQFNIDGHLINKEYIEMMKKYNKDILSNGGKVSSFEELICLLNSDRIKNSAGYQIMVLKNNKKFIKFTNLACLNFLVKNLKEAAIIYIIKDVKPLDCDQLSYGLQLADFSDQGLTKLAYRINDKEKKIQIIKRIRNQFLQDKIINEIK